jgi:hypothetical protein
MGWDFALGCAIAAIAAGIWLAFLAWQHASQMYAMLAMVLVLAAPAAAVALVVTRPDSPIEEDEPPESGIVDGRHRVESTLRIIALGRAHVWVITSYVVVMWICEAGGMVSLKGLLVFMTFSCTITVVSYLPWLSRREQRLYEERAELQRQLGEIEATRA